MDACSPVVALQLSCSSSQPDDGLGDGNTSDDCVISPDGQVACVRAERSGGDPAGRTYTLSVTAVDECSNAATVVLGTVFVPHDRTSAPAGCGEGTLGRDALPWALD